MSNLTIRQWLETNREFYGNTIKERRRWIKDCTKKLNFSMKSVSSKACEIWPERDIRNKPISDEEDVINPEKFIAEIDIVKHVEDFLNNVVKDGYIECEKLRKRLDVSVAKWRELKTLPIFKNRRFIYSKHTGNKTTVWSSEKGIQLAKDTISFSRYEV